MSAPIIIAGAGIGGLTLAAALRRAGVSCLVVERAPSFEPVGAGITIQPNAIAALRAFDMHETVIAAGQPAHEMRIRHFRGRTLSRLHGGQFERRFGAPLLGMHRADLHAVLLHLAGRDVVRVGFELAVYEERGEAVEVVSRIGERVSGRALVGADGLRSAVRAQLLGEEPPIYAGYTSWRGVVSGVRGVEPGRASESWGPGARFGIVPLPGGRTYWYATANAPAGGRDRGPTELRERFWDWHDPIPALLEATPTGVHLRTDIQDRPRPPRWTAGRVALLGDAVHPMTPDLGQGGCQAVEDAVVLARCLSAAADPAAAFAAYEHKRAERAAWVVKEARAFGALGQWDAASARFVRDTLVRLTPASISLGRMTRLYAFEP
jgi:2-polyprenyl-6-methoxyphenol hydroxylase-like FAD-dependent oxidoreductase